MVRIPTISPPGEGFTGTNIGWNVQNHIINIIGRGAATGENMGLRPLRELIQNADDAQADRVAIKIDESGMTFLNDGKTMTSDTETGMGTVEAIMYIEGGSKKDEEKTSGNFGTGFRSCHLYSEEAEIVGDVIIDGETRKPMVAICSPYTTEVDYEQMGRYVSLKTRDDSKRPKRTVLPESVDRDGVCFRFPWRRSVTSKLASKEWEAMLWPDEKIEELIEDFVKEIPRIIIGCRWIREAVFVIETDSTKGTHFWVKDFNIEESLKTGERRVYMDHSVVSKVLEESEILVEGMLGKPSREGFLILSERADGNQLRYAKEANYEPVCIIISPLEDDIEDGVLSQNRSLPSYTPIALTGDSGEGFGPLSFLPPHESRTKIKIDGDIDRSKVAWAQASLSYFSEKLLPGLLSVHLSMLEKGDASFSEDKMLSQLPTNRPDLWFSDLPLAHMSRDLVDAWQTYTDWTTSRSFVPTNNGLVKPSDSVFIDGFEEDEREVIVRVLESIGVSVMSQSAAGILRDLSKEYWGEEHPLSQATTVDDALSLVKAIDEAGEEIRLEGIGHETAAAFLEMAITDPSDVWGNSADRLRIPAIPDADGVLRPLKEDDDGYYFFDSMQDIPDILPSSRRIHPDYAEMLEGVTLGKPAASDIARMVHEAVTEDPGRFNNLEGEEELFRQVSKALVSITESDDFKINLVSEFRFIPCRVEGEIRVRRVNHVGEITWGVEVKPPVWRNFCRKEFIFSDPPDKRNTLGLHEEIINRISWLEIHPEIESKREEIGESLMMHKVVSNEPGINIIRSLVFGQTEQMSEFGEAPSMFDLDEDGNPEIDKWIGRDLDEETRDEILETLLGLLAQKGTLKSGWGNQSRTKVHGIRMLKDEDGAWQNVGDLCFELDSELSELFEKKAILPRHKELLGEELLTLPVNASGKAGLGVMKRVEEENIIEKLNSLDGQENETKTAIVEMMLHSNQEWELEDLDTSEWIPRLDGEVVSPEDSIVPTPEIVKLFGENHPWYLDLDSAGLDSAGVRARAEEIGILVDHEDEKVLLTALMGPEEVWTGLSGTELIEALTKIHRNTEEGASTYTGEKIGRLPNSDGDWFDESYVVPSADLEAISEVFPDCNVIDREVLGSKKAEEMAISWIIAPGMQNPGVSEIVQRLYDESENADPDREILDSLWRVVSSRQADLYALADSDADKHLLSPESVTKLVLPTSEDGLCRIFEMAFTGKKSRKITKGDHLGEVQLLPGNYPYKDVLKEFFGAIDLETVSAEEMRGIAADSKRQKHTGPALERLWLSIAMVGMQDEELLEMQIWPFQYYDRMGGVRR